MKKKEKDGLTVNEKLTAIGRCPSDFPVEITLGNKMLLMGSTFSQVKAALVLAAALSVQEPFKDRAYRDSDCESARRDLGSDHRDPFTSLNTYRVWLEISVSNNAAHTSLKSCSKKRALEEQRFCEITKLRQQFLHILADTRLLPGQKTKESSSSQHAVRHVN